MPHDTNFSNQPQQLSPNQEEGEEGDSEGSVTEVCSFVDPLKNTPPYLYIVNTDHTMNV